MGFISVMTDDGFATQTQMWCISEPRIFRTKVIQVTEDLLAVPGPVPGKRELSSIYFTKVISVSENMCLTIRVLSNTDKKPGELPHLMLFIFHRIRASGKNPYKFSSNIAGLDFPGTFQKSVMLCILTGANAERISEQHNMAEFPTTFLTSLSCHVHDALAYVFPSVGFISPRACIHTWTGILGHMGFSKSIIWWFQ